MTKPDRESTKQELSDLGQEIGADEPMHASVLSRLALVPREVTEATCVHLDGLSRDEDREIWTAILSARSASLARLEKAIGELIKRAKAIHVTHSQACAMQQEFEDARCNCGAGPFHLALTEYEAAAAEVEKEMEDEKDWTP